MDVAPQKPRSLRVRLSIGAGIVLVLIAAGIAVLVTALAPHGVTASAEPPPVVHSAAPAAADSPTAYVHVVGQVRHPGLYELPAGSRIVDAVAAAGGFTAAADQAQLNLAQVIEDGQQVVVQKRGTSPPTSGVAAGGMVDINTADATALETLTGIGPALAQRILDYRTAHGGFGTVADLQKVTGIGPKKFDAIKAHVST
jgi:competence protein ComEA